MFSIISIVERPHTFLMLSHYMAANTVILRVHPAVKMLIRGRSLRGGANVQVNLK